jgi:putative spermidine/putrescine transport system substrate-binding protein
MPRIITRREFLQAGAAVGLAAAGGGLLTACGGGSSAAPSGAAPTGVPASGSAPPASLKATYMCATGAFADAEKQAWINPFNAESGLTIIPDERDPTAELIKAAVDTGNFAFDMTLAFTGISEADWPKYFEKLDFTRIPKDEMDAAWVRDYWVVTDIAAEVFAYNLDATKGVEPTSLADLFDLTKIPGKRCLEDYYGTAYAWALMADGVAPDKLIPFDVARAQKKLDTIKDQIVWFTTGTQVQDLLSSGETPCGVTWNGRAMAGAKDGHPIKVLWNPQIFTYDRTVILKGTPNVEPCQEFLGYITSKENAGRITKYVPYVPANKYATLEPETKDWVPRLDQPAWIPDYDYWDSTFAELDPDFQAWKSS